ncbi:MAG: class III extradiol dioxygenase subunit B-like domain-containing protein [Candidatus Nealsonbacteria bacterium]
MFNIAFASICPHPPIILPSVGSKEDLAIAKKTIENLQFLGRKMKEAGPHSIIISSPHENWGFDVPLHFLAPNFNKEIKRYVTGEESPAFHFQEGRKAYKENVGGEASNKIALIASGDLSHCLKKDGPYGFNAQGPEFDKALIEALKNKDIEKILKLDELYPEAGECGLRSICFILGMLEESKISYETQILSYEGPWGVGYLVADFKLK